MSGNSGALKLEQCISDIDTTNIHESVPRMSLKFENIHIHVINNYALDITKFIEKRKAFCEQLQYGRESPDYNRRGLKHPNKQQLSSKQSWNL